MSAPGGASCLSFGRRAPHPAAAAPASDRDPPRPSPSLAASSASSCADAAPKPRTAGLEADGDKRTDGNDDDAELREILALAGIKLDDEPRDLFTPDVLRRVGEDAAAAVDPRVAAAVDALHSRCFPEGEDGAPPSWWRPGWGDDVFPPTPPTSVDPANGEEDGETNGGTREGRVPFEDDDPADDWHKRVGAALRDLAALNDAHRAEPSASPSASPAPASTSSPAPASASAPDGNRTRDLDRMLGACKVVLAWYSGVLEENASKCVPTPPLGTHVIRRRSIGDTDDADDAHRTHMANLASAWKPGDPQPFSPGLPTSLYVQDQCSYHYDVVRTADHFLDGTKQRVRASVKVVIAPRVTSAGATNVVVDLSRAPPPMPPPRPRVGLRPKSFFDDRSDPDWCRDCVCFVELGGASGHPDFLRRLRGKGDNPSVQESGTETEVYEFTPPGVLVGDFLRGPDDCQAVPWGRCEVECARTGLRATLDFGRGEAEHIRVGAVSGAIKRNGTNVAMVLGNLRGVGFHVARVDSPPVDGVAPTLDSSPTVAEVIPPDATKAGEIPRGFRGLYVPGGYANRRLWHACADSARRNVDWDVEHEGEVDQRIHAYAVFQMKQHWQRLEAAKVPLFLHTGIKGREMRYEFACIVADSPGPDQEPPLPRFWEDRKPPPLVDPEPDGLFFATSGEKFP